MTRCCGSQPVSAVAEPLSSSAASEGVAQERIVGSGASIPFGSRNGRDIGDGANRDVGGIGHGRSRASVDGEQGFDLDRRAQRQRSHADRRARMLARRAQRLRDQVGCAVHHLVLFGEVRR